VGILYACLAGASIGGWEEVAVIITSREPLGEGGDEDISPNDLACALGFLKK
jgi:hypothetical protein